jgi:NAD(P)H-hydrate epimerase
MKAAELNAAKRGISLPTLAENAAAACFDYIARRVSRHVQNVGDITAAILCGKGMNGGDGMLIAARLSGAGAGVLCVFADGTPARGLSGEIFVRHSSALPTVELSAYAAHAEATDAIRRAVSSADLIIDCVYGSGFRGELPASVAELFRFAGGCSPRKISVDLPSGIDADSGRRAPDAFTPDVTLCLGAFKKGLLAHPTCDFCGEVVLLDIGLIPDDYTAFTAQFTESGILARRPRPAKNSHKGSHGRLLNIAGGSSGDLRYVGAALLSTKAAIRTGAGLITLATPASVITAIAAAVPEAVFLNTDEHKAFTPELASWDAIVLGCGCGDDSKTGKTRKTAEYVIKNASCPIILDADGINSICDNINVLNTGKPDRLILTPHPGEFARMTGQTVEAIQRNRVDYAQLFAKESGAVIVLKGANTVIASPHGQVFVNPTGNAGLAKAGTGDVLAGVIGALAAGGVPPFEAATLGVYLHGLAADELAKKKPLTGISASDVAEKIAYL